MSVEFFGVGGPGQIGGVKNTQKSSNDKKVAGSNEDKVQFSSVLQDVNKAKAMDQNNSTTRAARVQELKAQIADGSYEPDLQKVSASLLKFLIGEG